jgi:hypothetical protein
MTADHLLSTGILGGSPQPAERCPRTGRIFQDGSGALSQAEQTAMFLRERAIEDDMPRPGESCPQTLRPYDCSIGAPTKTMQSAQFLADLPPEAKAQRQADANALFDAGPAGRA